MMFCLLTGLSMAQTTPSNPVRISLRPEQPLIEHRGDEQRLNFDFILDNSESKPLHLNRIQVSVFDASGQVVLVRELDENGHPSGMTTIKDRDVPASGKLAIFNPFYSFDQTTPLGNMRYRFYFNNPAYKTLTPLDSQYSAEITITPKDYPGKTQLSLPIHERFLVFDGHDFYSHHRRQNPTDPDFARLGIKGNPTRYAYDFCPVNEKGEMYKDTPYKKENWYGYGAPIYATADGAIAAAVNDVPENDYQGNAVVYADIPEDQIYKILGGNYVVIDHGDGEFSFYAHMQPGSVRVKAGDHVKQGQQIGQLGFAGDAFIPHLHYQLMTTSDVLKSEGLPSYFVRFRRILGSKTVDVDRGQIDTGDIVEAEKSRVVVK
jgi:hypothetical protein